MQRLLLDAGPDHFLLLVAQLLVGHVAGNAARLLFQIFGVLEGRRTVEVDVESPLHVGQLALHAGVPVVLDGVISAALEHFGDLGPLVVNDPVHQEEDPLLLLTPVYFLDQRIEVVVPALATLLSDAVFEVAGDLGPLLRAIGDHKLEHLPVFLLRPGALDVAVVFTHLAFFIILLIQTSR